MARVPVGTQRVCWHVCGVRMKRDHWGRSAGGGWTRSPHVATDLRLDADGVTVTVADNGQPPRTGCTTPCASAPQLASAATRDEQPFVRADVWMRCGRAVRRGSHLHHRSRASSGAGVRRISGRTRVGPSYQRAAAMQASLALTGTVAGVLAWQLGAGIEWLAGSAPSLFRDAPYVGSLIGANKRLLDPALHRNSRKADDLLLKWRRLLA